MKPFTIFCFIIIFIGFPVFLIEFHTSLGSDSHYIETVSEQPISEQLMIRFVNDEETRSELSGYAVLVDGEVYDDSNMIPIMRRQTVNYPPEAESVTLVLYTEEEVVERHEIGLE